MPKATHILGTPMDEEKWNRAKERAEEEGHAEEWDYVMGIYKKMSHSGEFQRKYVKQRKKKKQTLPQWKENTKDWEKKRVAVKKSSIDIGSEVGYTSSIGKEVRLIVSGQRLDEFRCGRCKMLLFKGTNLRKGFIEVKCRSCGTMNLNQTL